MEFIDNPRYKVQSEAKPVPLGDVFRVHDYNYLMKVIELSEKLKET